MELHYENLSAALSERIRQDRATGKSPDFAFPEEEALRRDPGKDTPLVWRTPFIRDIDKILHCPYYNRYADKTQVFSHYRNDDITRRGLHVQLVSRIARTLGKTLGLNLDLIEAIALGHDIGHTPFGHKGEQFLDELVFASAGRHFSHNIHSVRVLDGIFHLNLTLQTLQGIASHDGEWEMSEYRPVPLSDFAEFDRLIEGCYQDKNNVRRLVPSTLEGCVMRISDIIAYLGKDRQDAERTGLLPGGTFAGGAIGKINAEIIHNLMVNIIELSYGNPFIRMDETHFKALQEAKAENYALIYRSASVSDPLVETVRPMMTQMYERLLLDAKRKNTDSPLFTHHVAEVNRSHYARPFPYEETDPDQLVVDYIASMTDDYFMDLYRHLFPKSSLSLSYRGYFDEKK